MEKFAKMSLVVLLVFIFVGCTSKTIEVPRYVHNPAPVLELKSTTKTYEFGKLYNRNGKVCVKKWEGCAEFSAKENKCIKHYSNCIPKKDFINLVDYLQDLGGTIQKGNKQVATYNEWAKIQNKKAEESKFKADTE